MGFVFVSGGAGHMVYRMLKKAASSFSHRSALDVWTTLGLRTAALLDGFDIVSLTFQTESGFSFATGFPPLMCSSRMVATSASVTLEYQVASG